MTTERDLIQRLADALTNAIRVIHNEDGTQHISTATSVLAEAHAFFSQPEPPLEEQRCENCCYHLQSLNECRRNAPQPSDRQESPAWWPVVADGDWCGEWVKS